MYSLAFAYLPERRGIWKESRKLLEQPDREGGTPLADSEHAKHTGMGQWLAAAPGAPCSPKKHTGFESTGCCWGG